MSDLTAADLVRAARRHGFELMPAGRDVDATGADFIVAHAVDLDDVAWIVKVPRRADVMVRADAERRVLRLLRERLAVAVPDWRLFAPDVIAYPRVPGEPAAVIDPDLGDWRWRFDPGAPPQAFLDSLARFLAQLHGIDVDEARAAGVRVLDPRSLRAATAECIERARNGLDVPDPLWRRWHDWVADDGVWPDVHVLVHGDLHGAHLLVDDDNAISGVLDWSEAHVGDPATDFALLYPSLGDAALASLLDAYGAAGGRTWPGMARHVVERWLAYPAVIADFARMTGDDQPMQLAQALVDEAMRRVADA